MAGTIGTYQYISDDGTTYALRMGDVGAAAQGAAATTGSEPNYKAGYHPRHLYIEYSTYRRKVPICDPADTQWTGASTAWSMKIFPTDAAPVDWNIRGRIGERRFSL